ncbi:Exonuclease RNase T and DNA polymerase III [Weissella koreensis KACC 15510]|uniref:3'-5' exonuclease n=1 Tax=Weissella koreensis TaxID=165096 RepID=UPI0002174CC0|nr:3'-5' exonuclease [Weissella koreensis]AEJ23268.1 Exonuclease RNase T and DNA polymerase III [Weissella koreensis KACC 15510]
MNFIAMDFETANAKRYSAVSIAVVVVRDDQVVNEFYSLLKPPTDFSQQNINIHGIHPQDVADAPQFPLVWQKIQQFYTGEQLVVAHNAAFDNSVLKATLEYYHLPTPHYLSLDTVKTSRRLYPQLTNHKLNTVAEALEIPLHHHHHALDDTLAAAQILLKQSQEFGVDPLKSLVKVI